MSARNAWITRGGRGFGPAPFLVAGIVNLTPDSFSDGGSYPLPQDAVTRCRELLAQGAAILDLGGESTRPGFTPVTVNDELARLMPVVAECVSMRDTAEAREFHVAVDTRHAVTAAAVLEAGVDIINDVSGEARDPAMAEILGEYKPGYVLMHAPLPSLWGAMRDDSVVDDVLRFFETAMAERVAAGLPEENIILDPGIGFGKTAEHNMAILRAVRRLLSLGRPLYVGISRKRLFGDFLGLPVESRDAATQVATALLGHQGVYVHRVHDVAGAVRALRLAALMT